MSASLAGPLAKLDRAYEHLESFDPEVAAFYATEPYVVEPERDAQTGEHVFRLRIRENPPLRLGTIVGDFATNTRAALDHLVRQLVILNNGTPTGSTAFPVYKAKAEVANDRKRPLDGVSQRHRALILKHQPYVAGNDAEKTVVSLLSWLVNTDKHRVIHAMYGYVTLDCVQFTFRTAGSLLVPSTYDQIMLAKGPRRAVDGAELARVKLPNPDLEVEMHGDLSVDVAFGETSMRATVLQQIYDWVRQLVEAFAPDFP